MGVLGIILSLMLEYGNQSQPGGSLPGKTFAKPLILFILQEAVFIDTGLTIVYTENV